MSDFPATKDAWVFVHSIHPYCVGYPGVVAELFFSSKEKFMELWGRPLDEYETLVKVQVPEDFTDWDYVPNDY